MVGFGLDGCRLKVKNFFKLSKYSKTFFSTLTEESHKVNFVKSTIILSK